MGLPRIEHKGCAIGWSRRRHPHQNPQSTQVIDSLTLDDDYPRGSQKPTGIPIISQTTGILIKVIRFPAFSHPGGRLVLTDWLRTEPMTAREYADHLTPVCRFWATWRLESLHSYCAKLRAHGLNVLEAEDLGEQAKPNAYLLHRLARDYENGAQPAIAQLFGSTARAWIEERITLGRILAIK